MSPGCILYKILRYQEWDRQTDGCTRDNNIPWPRGNNGNSQINTGSTIKISHFFYKPVPKVCLLSLSPQGFPPCSN